MAAGKLHFKSDAGGITSVSREAGATNGELVLPVSGTVASVSTAVTDNAIARYDSTTGKLQNSSITIDDSGNIGTGTQSFNGFGGTGFKNYIINGNFDIWQRGVSFTATTAFAYMADRFRIKTTSGTCSVIKNPTGLRTNYTQSLSKTNYITIGSNNNGEIEMSQPIEDVRTLAGKNVTVSFNAAIFQGSKNNINICIMQFFGTGGSASVNTDIKTISVKANDGSTAVDRYNATFNLPSIAGKTITSNSQLVLIILIPDGSYAFDIGELQLEEGSVATPFEQRPCGLELSLCQRYYEIGYIKCWGVATASIQSMGHTQSYKVTKRVIPTVVFTNTMLTNVTAIASETEGQYDTLVAYANSIASGTYAYQATFIANAEL